MTEGLENPGMEDEQVSGKLWAQMDFVSMEYGVHLVWGVGGIQMSPWSCSGVTQVKTQAHP